VFTFDPDTGPTGRGGGAMHTPPRATLGGVQVTSQVPETQLSVALHVDPQHGWVSAPQLTHEPPTHRVAVAHMSPAQQSCEAAPQA
jgi:hypothetical protein